MVAEDCFRVSFFAFSYKPSYLENVLEGDAILTTRCRAQRLTAFSSNSTHDHQSILYIFCFLVAGEEFQDVAAHQLQDALHIAGWKNVYWHIQGI